MSPDQIEHELAADERARLAYLAETLRVLRRHVVYVDYAEAERACERLAASLSGEFGTDDLRRFAYQAIPRGGLIVLGILSYVLDLPATCFNSDADPGRPLVIVDDCALSGARFGRELKSAGSRAVVFAHLYSHPELRSAILRAEPGVEFCVAARNLEDRLDCYLPDPRRAPNGASGGSSVSAPAATGSDVRIS